MRAHVLQHAAFEGLGRIEGWLQDRGARVGWTRFFAGDPLPPVDALDLVIAMGGPMSVNDEETLPWLRDEKRFVREAIERDVPVLGICLGAQLIASSLGARVYPNAVKEIGWHKIAPAGTGSSLLRVPPDCTVFQWHGETFDLPRGATLLATSAGCVNQAFQLRNNVLGLQFHVEMTPQSVRSLVDHCREDLTPGPYVQTAREIEGASSATYDAMHTLLRAALDGLWA